MQSDHASPAMTSEVIGAVGAYGAKFLKQQLRTIKKEVT